MNSYFILSTHSDIIIIITKPSAITWATPAIEHQQRADWKQQLQLISFLPKHVLLS
jgi:hypothetical protein